MTTITFERFAAIEPALGGGMKIRTAKTLRDLITELISNSGEDIAYWAEAEAKRVADRWREYSDAEKNEVLPDAQ